MDPSCTVVDNVRYCLTRAENIGLAFITESGFISLGATVVVFMLILRNMVVHAKATPHKWKLIRVPADAYMLCLFAFDFVQAMGEVLNVKWIHTGYVQVGDLCSAQGALKQLGQTGVAITTLVIAVHTFVTVLWRKGVKNLIVPYSVIALIWVFVILFVAISSKVLGVRKFYTPTPFWCWVNGRHDSERIAGEYLWIWLAVFGSFIFYVTLFLWNRGNITVDRAHWWKVKFYRNSRVKSAASTEERERPGASSLALLAYPLIYSLLVLPLTFIRWIEFSKETNGTWVNYVPPAATFSAEFIFGLSGAMNVVLILTTRPELLLFGRVPATQHASIPLPPQKTQSQRPSSQQSLAIVGPVFAVKDGRLCQSDSDWDLPMRNENA